ncbi:hypothetical protein [Tardiphaga sp.]|jgi:hypothetical protein|uniref:hypothetical protein n=1 Tax=Tardiphaga sp. TaxID=1926292 RepID=UPI0037DA6D2E
MTTVELRGDAARSTLSAAAFAVALLAFQLLLIGFGLAGMHGNSAITASWLVLSEIAILVLSWRAISAKAPDYIFVAFFTSVMLSIFLSFDRSLINDYARFAICVPLAYFAGRSLNKSVIARVPDVMLIVSSVVLVIAVAALLYSFAVDGVGGLERTTIFGFNHAPNVLAVTAGCFAISFIFSRVRMRSALSAAVLTLLFVACAAFAVALVRFTIVAILATAMFAAAWLLFTNQRDRAVRAAVVFLLCITSCGAAVYLRPSGVINFTNEAIADAKDAIADAKGAIADARGAIQKPSAVSPERLPSCTESARLGRSVEIRSYLLKDAFFLLPTSGLLGYGLGSFSSITCLKGHEVHNIFLQTFIETGFVAGTLLIALFIALAAGLMSMPNAGFLLSCLVLYTIIGMAHGSITIAMPLFLIAGAASAVRADGR